MIRCCHYRLGCCRCCFRHGSPARFLIHCLQRVGQRLWGGWFQTSTQPVCLHWQAPQTSGMPPVKPKSSSSVSVLQSELLDSRTQITEHCVRGTLPRIHRTIRKSLTLSLESLSNWSDAINQDWLGSVALPLLGNARKVPKPRVPCLYKRPRNSCNNQFLFCEVASDRIVHRLEP